MQPITSENLESYLRKTFPEKKNLRVDGLYRLPLGASRETFRFDLVHQDAAGQDQVEKMILRRDPPASNVDSDRQHEFLSYKAIYGHGIPVPKMLLLENDASFFGGAISIAEDLRGFHNSEYQLQEAAWQPKLPHIAREFYQCMGRLAAVDTGVLDLAFMPPTTRETTASIELENWVEKLEKNSLEPEPVCAAAIRYLRSWQPVASKLAMVHGDLRAGNFLYNDEGDLIAVLDWEMAHVGDPLEDLAWSLNRAFCFGKDDRRGGLVSREQAIVHWEEGSGIKVDPRALHWWELFACIKGQAIWNTCGAIWQENRNRDVVYAYASWWLRNTQDRAILELMGKL